jgi:HEPN domain-containing protein
MAMDPQKIADARAWLVKAQCDLETARQLLEHTDPLLDSVVYHCHQAAEKALKGYLFWYDIPFHKTHDLGELLAQCISTDAGLAASKATAIMLTPLATEFRYPGDIVAPPLEEAREAFDRAGLLVTELVSRLPAEVRPA